jgi:uncharacterized RDD family membrane protein YckC
MRAHGEAAASAEIVAPSLVRRMAAFVYEGVMLFGVLMVAGYLYSTLTQQRHALQGLHGLQAFVFGVLGVYFSWFWSHGGQTVAMKAWHLRLVDRQGAAVTMGRACARYLAAWIWFLPALVVAWLGDQHGLGGIFGLMAGWAALYALLSFARPDRQFWHDALCGTRLVFDPATPRG